MDTNVIFYLLPRIAQLNKHSNQLFKVYKLTTFQWRGNTMLFLTGLEDLDVVRSSSVVERSPLYDGSSDRCLVVEPLSYFSFHCSITAVPKVVVCTFLSV